MRPRVFIGSSSEGLGVAYALQNNLENEGDVTVWNQDVFRPTEYILESLVKQLHLADLGIFVFSADDLTLMRGEEHAVVRDNVIFEFGLFVGHLGRENSIIVSPKQGNPRLPSDLLGITVLKYSSDRDDGNLEAALGPASTKIRLILGELHPKASSIPRELALPFLERRGLLTTQQRDLLGEIESRQPCSARDLAEALPRISPTELGYRLEQLRLLMFISVEEGSGADTNSTTYMLTEAYRAASKGTIRPFRSVPAKRRGDRRVR